MKTFRKWRLDEAVKAPEKRPQRRKKTSKVVAPTKTSKSRSVGVLDAPGGVL